MRRKVTSLLMTMALLSLLLGVAGSSVFEGDVVVLGALATDTTWASATSGRLVPESGIRPVVRGVEVSTGDPEASQIGGGLAVWGMDSQWQAFATALSEQPGNDYGESGGTISGHVYGADGETAIEGATIAVFLGEGEPLTWTLSAADGSYTTPGLPAGEYHLWALAQGYASEWYQESYSRADAVAVQVTAPDNVQGIDFTLEPGSSISGQVKRSNDQSPVEAARILVLGLDRFAYAVGWSEADGSYTTTGLLDGQYRVLAQAEGYVNKWYDGAYGAHDAALLTVTDDRSGIDFSLEIGGTISGRVADSETHQGIADLHVNAHDYETDLWVAGSNTDPEGYYTLFLPSGSYRVGTHPGVTGLNYIGKHYDDKYGWHDADPVQVVAPDNTPEINFSLEIGGTISGHVYDANSGDPIAHAHIQVIEYDSLYDGWLHLGWGHTDHNGYYVTTGLPAGQYALEAHASGYFSAWYDAAYFPHQATPVAVTVPHNTDGIDFGLEPTVPRDTIEDAIADGAAWLASQQNPDGSWGTYYQVTKTALAVLTLQTHAADLGMSEHPEYPYREHIDQGFSFLLSHAYITGVTPQPAGNPDSNGNGIGVYFRSPVFPPDRGHAYDTYETSIALMAIGASTEPGRMVDLPGSVVDGWSFAGVAQDVVDYLAWGQTDFGFGRGGWNYHPMDVEGERSDQSNTGWVTLGLMYAEDFGSLVPDFVKGEIDIWIDYIQDRSGGPDDGGSWYTGPADPDPPIIGANLLRTGNLLQQMAFVGDTESTPRVQAAVDYLVRHWWSYPNCYHTTYTVMKGLEQLAIETIDSIDWFQDFAHAIMNQQRADGGWMPGGFDYAARVLSTTWALLTLQTEIPPTKMGPDLIIAENHAEWVDEGQGTYTVHFAVKNRGNVEAPAGHHLGLVVNDFLIEEKVVPVVLAPGDTYSGIFDTVVTLALPHDKITVCADIYDVIDELNEENNCLTSYLPPAYPDLVISEKYEAWHVEGESYTVHYTLENTGVGPALYGHYVGLRVNGVWIEHRPVPVVLAAGEAYSDSFHTVITLSPIGDEIMVCADIYGYVDELDEENNCLSNSWSAEGWLVNLTLTTDPHVGRVPGPGYNLAFGAKHGATEGFGAAEGDQIAPQPPQMGVEAYFRYDNNPQFQQKLVTSVVGPTATIVWPLLVKSAGDPEDTQATLTWDPDAIENVPAKYATLELQDTDGNRLADLRTDSSYAFELPSGTTRSFHIVASEHIEFVYQMKAGWNMISLPLHTQETSPHMLFPGHVAIYTWDAGELRYEVPTQLIPGRGYWILYFDDASIPVVGVPVEQYELTDAVAGWHMIGSLAIDAEVNVTAGTTYHSFYWWNPQDLNYEATDTLEPGNGYWLLGFTPFSMVVEPVPFALL